MARLNDVLVITEAQEDQEALLELMREALTGALAQMQAMYEEPDESALEQWGVGYVVFDGSVFAKYDADERWYAERYLVWYESDTCRVYKIVDAG